MTIEEAIESMKTSLVWGSWSKSQSDAIRTLLLETEKVKMLENENSELRKRINTIN
jgi:hypothetical protein